MTRRCSGGGLRSPRSRPSLAVPRRAAADAVDDLLGRVAKARAGLRTLQGPFTQTRTVGLLSTDVRSTGVMILVVPDRLRWELAPPDDVTFWVVPEGVAYRSASGVGRLPPSAVKTAGALDDLRAALSGDPRALRARWDLHVLKDDATGAPSSRRARTTRAPSTKSASCWRRTSCDPFAPPSPRGLATAR